MDSSNSQSSAICQRLINFILHNLRRPRGLTGVPIEEGSSRKLINGSADSEIAVDFRHADEHRDTISLSPNKHGLIVSNDHANGKGLQETEAHSGAKKTVTIKGSDKKKKEGDGDHQEIMVKNHHHHPHDETIPRIRQHWPLRSVTSNIDKKSDEYIRSRKKAMGRNYSLDHEKS